MKAQGNGAPAQCIDNLLKLFQYEVPYARLKGMDTKIVDLPQDEAIQTGINHVTWLVENYEPRVTLESVSHSIDKSGNIIFTPNVKINEE